MVKKVGHGKSAKGEEWKKRARRSEEGDLPWSNNAIQRISKNLREASNVEDGETHLQLVKLKKTEGKGEERHSKKTRRAK